MRRPDFITFTGADDRTDVTGMQTLADRYPIEWGILFSPTRQGHDPRYPGEGVQTALCWSGLRLSAHLCGGYSQAIMEGRPVNAINFGIFKRIQVNHRAPQAKQIASFRSSWSMPRCIAQTRRATFPADQSVDWLFDRSGGHGEEPISFPSYPDRMAGYAGGIGPDNVIAVIERINASGPYWLDMESKVRSHNWFDVSLCEQVCKAVYG